MLKRFFDIFISLFGIIILSPVIAFVAWKVYRKLGTPIFFRQTRSSINGKSFEMIKFRTMLDTTDKHGKVLPNDLRLTQFGRALRASSLDELPELLNVLKGDMSLVGPRPLLIDYLDLYSPEQARRHEVKSGLTGWAQINGRNSLTWAEKFELDVWYVDHRSIWLDIKILLLTIKKVLIKEGINSDTDVTMPRFTGKN